MAGTLLLVHGTGVRAAGYTALLRVIEREASRFVPSAATRGCFWGEAFGAQLQAGGASIPDYDVTGGESPTDTERDIALWSILYTDPWYELRLLRHHPGGGPAAFGVEPPSIRLRRRVDEFAPTPGLVARLSEHGLADSFDAALAAIRLAPEFDEAIATAPTDPIEHSQAIARALMAYALVSASEEGQQPVLDGATRNALLETLTDELAGYGMGVSDWLARPFVGIAKRLATRRLIKDRGAISDASSPAAGDILRFLAHGGPTQGFLRDAINDAEPPVTVLAHSLGGIIAVALLAREEIPNVRGLVTVGSQSSFLYEIGALPGLAFGNALPQQFPAWLNVYDKRDFLSYLAEPLFPGRVRDVEVDNGQPFPQSHSAYWTNSAVWREIAAFVA